MKDHHVIRMNQLQATSNLPSMGMVPIPTLTLTTYFACTSYLHYDPILLARSYWLGDYWLEILMVKHNTKDIYLNTKG